MISWNKIYHKIGTINNSLKDWYEKEEKGIYTLEHINKKVKCSEGLLKQFLNEMQFHHLVEILSYQYCDYCKDDLQENEIETHKCFEKDVISTTSYTKYKILKPRSNDVTWMIAIHGMNTFGAWQQDFSWQLAKIYKYSVPVSIYKYGNIKIKPFLYLSRKPQVIKFANAIREKQKEMGQGKPDIIAHSYGTLLLSEILKNNEFKDIKVGRIILAGSIVRPDFDWQSLINSKRVESVMCHHSKMDKTVLLAQYGIPGSGPSGNVGFNDKNNVHHVYETSYVHSDYFTKQNLTNVIKTHWKPFLTQPKDTQEPNPQDGKWKPSICKYLSHPLKYSLLIAIFAIVLILIPIMIYHGYEQGIEQIKSWINLLI